MYYVPKKMLISANVNWTEVEIRVILKNARIYDISYIAGGEERLYLKKHYQAKRGNDTVLIFSMRHLPRFCSEYSACEFIHGCIKFR